MSDHRGGLEQQKVVKFKYGQNASVATSNWAANAYSIYACKTTLSYIIKLLKNRHSASETFFVVDTESVMEPQRRWNRTQPDAALFCIIFQPLLEGLAQNLLQTLVVPRQCVLLLLLHEVDICIFDFHDIHVPPLVWIGITLTIPWLFI